MFGDAVFHHRASGVEVQGSKTLGTGEGAGSLAKKGLEGGLAGFDELLRSGEFGHD